MPTNRKTTDTAPEPTPVPAPSAVFADLLSEVGRDVIGWIPEREGETLAGVIVGDEIITTSFVDKDTGETVVTDLPVSIFDVNPTDSTLPYVRFVWMGVVLLNAYRRHRPTRLDQCAVRLTKKSGGTGVGDYDDWRVVVHKAPENRHQAEAVAETIGVPRRTATPAATAPSYNGDPGPADPGEEEF